MFQAVLEELCSKQLQVESSGELPQSLTAKGHVELMLGSGRINVSSSRGRGSSGSLKGY